MRSDKSTLTKHYEFCSWLKTKAYFAYLSFTRMSFFFSNKTILWFLFVKFKLIYSIYGNIDTYFIKFWKRYNETSSNSKLEMQNKGNETTFLSKIYCTY